MNEGSVAQVMKPADFTLPPDQSYALGPAVFLRLAKAGLRMA